MKHFFAAQNVENYYTHIFTFFDLFPWGSQSVVEQTHVNKHVETGHTPSLPPDNDNGDMGLFDSLRSLTRTASFWGTKIFSVLRRSRNTLNISYL